jgi:hypothetical protein
MFSTSSILLFDILLWTGWSVFPPLTREWISEAHLNPGSPGEMSGPDSPSQSVEPQGGQDSAPGDPELFLSFLLGPNQPQ